MERMAVAAWSDERLTINVERLRFISHAEDAEGADYLFINVMAQIIRKD